MAAIQVSAFEWVVPFAQGLVRDLRVRWALEEVGLSYDERLVALGQRKAPEHRALQPFGQVPTFHEGELTLFESGAIVLHLAESYAALMPEAPADRARVKQWMFAALNTIEPPITTYAFLELSPPGVVHGTERFRASVLAWMRERLDELAGALGDRPWLVGDRFTAADLLMVSVLRAARTTDLVARRPRLHAYVARAEARPAFARALEAQLATFARHAPADEQAAEQALRKKAS